MKDRRWRSVIKIGDEGLGDEQLAKQRVDEGEKIKWEGKRKKEEKPERETVKKKENENIF